jgi:hypothetical protein
MRAIPFLAMSLIVIVWQSLHPGEKRCKEKPQSISKK